MKGLLAVLAHLLTTLASLLGPGGSRAIVADSLLLKQQLLIINRSRKRAPNLTATDRILVTIPQSTPYTAVCSYHQVINTAEIPRSTQET